jgi:hypothetical protein
MTDPIRLKFPDGEQIPADAPDASHLASRFDADPVIR